MPVEVVKAAKPVFFWGKEGVAQFIDKPDPVNEAPLNPQQRNAFVLVNLDSGAMAQLDVSNYSNGVRAAKILVERGQIPKAGLARSRGVVHPQQMIYYEVLTNLNWKPSASVSARPALPVAQ